jgi:peptidoglycan hydrolase-like protein with peptidoglycan-binding domain
LLADGWVGEITQSSIQATVTGHGAVERSNHRHRGITLRQGEEGPAVADLQYDLHALNFYEVGEIDGKFGPRTNDGVRRFQEEHNLKVDGIVGPITWAALDEALQVESETGTVHLGSAGAGVRELQADLKRLHFYSGDIDGEFGPKTDTAVREFQDHHELVVDGIAGPKTFEKLRQVLGYGHTNEKGDLSLRQVPSGSVVTQLQQDLTDLHFDPGAIDGWFGPRTDAALRAFQREYNLVVDGIYGRKTQVVFARVNGHEEW